jgi:tetratricopeptide (TPR) repeat protein
MKLGMTNLAISNNSKGLHFYPLNPFLLFNRSLNYLKIHRFEEALADITAVLSAGQTDGEFYSVRSMIYYKLGRMNDALRDL